MKLKIKTGLMVLILLAGCIDCLAQGYDIYKQKAYTSFYNGEYKTAQKALNMYNDMTGNKISELSEKVALCLKYQASADGAERSGNYVSARSYYRKILKCNPKDPNMSGEIARLNKLIESQGEEKENIVVYVPSGQQTAASKLDFRVNGVSFTMRRVAGGTFYMGAQSTNSSGQNYDADAYDWDGPVHRVTLSDYYIGEYEVTQALWQAVMGNNPSYFSGTGHGNYPVEDVSWNNIQSFLTALNAATASQRGNKRFALPTEAQWEFAARGGNNSRHYKYAGSNDVSAVAYYYGNSSDQTHSVGMKQPNELGLYDMSGNVWEWCSDWYWNYSTEPVTDPAGPSTGSGRVLRGGGWYFNFASWCRVSYRSSHDPDIRSSDGGFRLVLLP